MSECSGKVMSFSQGCRSRPEPEFLSLAVAVFGPALNQHFFKDSKVTDFKKYLDFFKDLKSTGRRLKKYRYCNRLKTLQLLEVVKISFFKVGV